MLVESKHILQVCPRYRAASPARLVREYPDYLRFGKLWIYGVWHHSAEPCVGQVLLAGPFASQRQHSHVLWVRWARYLATLGLDVLRFDYRGVGESTGEFSQCGLREWLEDLHLCAQRLRQQDRELPLMLHGLELGAVLASLAFNDGVGDGMLLWSPPAGARELLLQALRLRLSADYARNGSSLARKTRQDYIKELESGNPVEVDGFTWSERLWRESEQINTVLPDPDKVQGISVSRPWRVVQLDKAAGALHTAAMSSMLLGVPRLLNPDLQELFQDSGQWIRSSLTNLGGS